jgi:hypothetical protein
MSDHSHVTASAAAQPPAGEPDGARDGTVRFALYAIVGAIIFPPVGVVYTMRSIREARRTSRPQVLPYVAFLLVTLSVITYSLLLASKTG